MSRFTLNGAPAELDLPGDTPLLWALRDGLGLTGTKFGCGMAHCGACTVHLDGLAARACVTPLSAVEGRHVTTIEGLGQPTALHPCQQAWVELSVPQCGYCQSGQLMSDESGVPTGFWRSAGQSHTAFATEGFIDECAHAARQDPLAFRRRLLQAHPRHLAVLDAAATRSGWGRPPPAGRARGVAVHESINTVVAAVAEVAVEAGAIRVHRVVLAMDCGRVVNPDGVRAQLESAAVFGLSAALLQQVTFKGGKVQQSNFHDYPALRMNEPLVEAVLLPSEAPPCGVGEPGLPVIAPAVANAVFALTGQRLRSLPLTLAT